MQLWCSNLHFKNRAHLVLACLFLLRAPPQSCVYRREINQGCPSLVFVEQLMLEIASHALYLTGRFTPVHVSTCQCAPCIELRMTACVSSILSFEQFRALMILKMGTRLWPRRSEMSEWEVVAPWIFTLTLLSISESDDQSNYHHQTILQHENSAEIFSKASQRYCEWREKIWKGNLDLYHEDLSLSRKSIFRQLKFRDFFWERDNESNSKCMYHVLEPPASKFVLRPIKQATHTQV